VLAYLTMIFVCQLAGELLVTAINLPVPGPVCGMAILFLGLLVYGTIPPALGEVGGALLDNLSLLFVPAGAGVMLHATLIGRDWAPIAVSLLASTALAIAVTAWLMSRLTVTNDGKSAASGKS